MTGDHINRRGRSEHVKILGVPGVLCG